MFNSSGYSLLRKQVDSHDPPSALSFDTYQACVTRTPGIPLWAFLGCLLCTILNLIIVWTSFRDPESAQLLPPRRTDSLPRPNQYIGLETVNRTGPGVKGPAPLVNHPLILTQISSLDKGMVFPEAPHRWFSWVGTVYPDDRHFVISEHIHTIAQFRVRDFGMESCQVVITIPTDSELRTVPAPPAGAPGNKSVVLIEPPSVGVQVWKLGPASELDVRTLSWKTRPPRRELVATLDVAIGERSTTQQFACPSDSLQTFEVACATDQAPCLLEFWQDKMDPMIAAFLLQHSTVN